MNKIKDSQFAILNSSIFIAVSFLMEDGKIFPILLAFAWLSGGLFFGYMEHKIRMLEIDAKYQGLMQELQERQHKIMKKVVKHGKRKLD